MRISVRLIAPRGGMPPDFDADGRATVDLDDGGSLADLLDGLELPNRDIYMTLVNGESVVAANRAAYVMADGDELTLFPPLQGG